eukprot:6475078-Amphidinium_carterae.5
MSASKGRTPDFPRVATPNFNPDIDFRYDDHGQSIAPNAQQALDAPPGAPTIIKIGEPTPSPQWGQLNNQNVQMWNMQQQNATQNVQSQPTPL